jgi:signal peptidase II
MKLSSTIFYDATRTPRLAAVALAILVADQLSKLWLLDYLAMGAHAPVEVTSFFKLVMVWNYGISFGMLAMPDSWMPVLLIALAVVISAILWRLAHQTHDRVEALAYMVIIGGALGNAIDRVRYGAVADFFYFHVGSLGWPAFNIADASIFCGVAAILFRSVLSRQRT